MKIPITKDIDTKDIARELFTEMIECIGDYYGINEKEITQESLDLLVDEIYKEMKTEIKEMEEYKKNG